VIPEWEARYGEAAWEAMLVVSGEISPWCLDALTADERAYYALAPKD
jgi:hypothetical protein